MDNRDTSNNTIHRRYNNGRVYVTDERHAETNEHERFNLNQYYNAVEDEQIYMDEYTSLLHRYNDFIVNSNMLFLRMEQTLRENIARAIARQTYYYNETDYLYRRELRSSLQYRSHAQAQAPGQARAASIPASSAPSLRPSDSPIQRFGDVLPRLVSRYISTENAREQRLHNTNNIFSMLYTFPIEAVGGRGGAASETRTDGPPTNDEINRATLNTVFAHILSPVNATCPISRDEFNDESEITMIRGCNHVFNRSSLREWLANHATCPMCRMDIREYRPPSLQEPSAPPHPEHTSHRTTTDIPRNISIDSADRDHVTFSYDLPSNTNNEDIYRNLINTVANIITNNSRNHGDGNDGNDDDIMEVD